MNGLFRIACAAGAAFVRWLARAPIRCGAGLLAWAGALERKARPPGAADG